MNKTLNRISSLVPNNACYKNIASKLNFDGFQIEPITQPKRTKVLKVAIPSSVVLFSTIICFALVLLLPLLANNSSSRLAQLNDEKIIAVLASYQSEAEAIPMSAPGLDKVYENYISFKKSDNFDINFFCETKLSADSFYICYYLPNTTIEKIEAIIDEETLPNYLFINPESTIDNNPLHSYLRVYWYLYKQDILTDDDRLFVSKEQISNKTIDVYVEDCVLVKITRNINIQNKEFGNLFLEGIDFKYEEKNAHIVDITSVSEKLNDKTIVYIDAPYLKSLFNSDVYDASFLNCFTYLIDETNNTFNTFTEYDQYLLDKDENYYDAINDIIINKEYVTTSVYNDNDGVLHKLDTYKVICDYNKSKILFDIE